MPFAWRSDTTFTFSHNAIITCAFQSTFVSFFSLSFCLSSVTFVLSAIQFCSICVIWLHTLQRQENGPNDRSMFLLKDIIQYFVSVNLHTTVLRFKSIFFRLKSEIKIIATADTIAEISCIYFCTTHFMCFYWILSDTQKTTHHNDNFDKYTITLLNVRRQKATKTHTRRFVKWAFSLFARIQRFIKISHSTSFMLCHKILLKFAWKIARAMKLIPFTNFSIRSIKMDVCFVCFLEISIWFDWCLFQEENAWEWNAHLAWLGEASICFPFGNGGAYTLVNWGTDGRVDVPIECIFISYYSISETP